MHLWLSYKSTSYTASMFFVKINSMQRKRTKEQLSLIELNQKFVEQVELGASWDELKIVLDDMTELAKNIDLRSATVISFDNQIRKDQSG